MASTFFHHNCIHNSFTATLGVFLLLLLLLLLLSFSHTVLSGCTNSPLIFAFGDSNSDTGGLVAGLGYSVSSPNGRTFFKYSTGRLCDGRLIIDFLCESVNTSLLRPYMESVGTTFLSGASFAVVGSTTLPRNAPFALNIQVLQFLHFKSRNLQLSNSGLGNIINKEGFRNALYIIDIGQNDLADAFRHNLSYAEIVKRIRSVLSEIKTSIKDLYNDGARKFWVHNTGPLGCLPQKLVLVQKKYNTCDTHGCLSVYNKASMLFNEGLRHLCRDLRNKLKEATVVYVDIYSIKYDLIANSTKYGFSAPLMACCGHGGPPYNYNQKVSCGHQGHNVCPEGSQFVSWDGIHYTEVANSVVASKILSRDYSTPSTAFDFFCN